MRCLLTLLIYLLTRGTPQEDPIHRFLNLL